MMGLSSAPPLLEHKIKLVPTRRNIVPNNSHFPML
jgi:hypothetical protein